MNTIERIDSVDALEAQLEIDSEQPLWILKHSLTCPVSDAGLREYERFVEAAEAGSARFMLIEIQRARPVSAELTERSGVRHESPQALLFKSGKAVWNASHWEITAASLAAAMDG